MLDVEEEDDMNEKAVEMSWSDIIEERLIYISEEAKDRSIKHDSHSKCKKKLYYTSCIT